MSNRIQKLRAKLAEKDLDAILISTPENRRYLSGFTGSAGYLVITMDDTFMATDFRYIEQATKQSPDFEIVKIGIDWSWLRELLEASGSRSLAFEGSHLTVSTYRQIADAFQSNGANRRVGKSGLIATKGLVEGLRAVKDTDELAQVQRAIDIADETIEKISHSVQHGETELEVAWHLEKTMRELGADSTSFDIIVAAGPNGAMPHHRPTDRAIVAGEPIVIDMGAKAGGYCSDITRTVCAGEPDETFRKIYDIVLGAQLTSISTVRPGMTGRQADELSRVVIAEAGYGDFFGHSLGHGIGLAVHEYPGVGPKSDHILEEGMVFTIEPGIYVSGWGGVRIEDMVVLEKDGAKVLTSAPK